MKRSTLSISCTNNCASLQTVATLLTKELRNDCSFAPTVMKFSHLSFLILALWWLPHCLCGVIRDFLQNNVAGPAVNFQEQSWPIDPDAGLRRRKDYVEQNGLYGYRHVERIGLGEDGRTEERRIQQRIRDSQGRLSYAVPP